MREKIIFTLILAFSLIIPIEAAIINIPDDYATIQAGIDVSTDGDTVLAAEGHYFERINFHGKGILVTSEFMLDGDTAHIQNTIIDADTLVLGVADTGSVVCFVSGEDSTSVIQGFSIKNGTGTLYSDEIKNGGGIYCQGSSPTIVYNIISGNSADGGDGGGIYCLESFLTLTNNRITGNSAEAYGGGIHCTYSFPIISNNIINENSSWYGAGIAGWESSLIISDNVLCENHALALGGGFICLQSSSSVFNNTISGNTAGSDGGGIYLFDSNSIITGNSITGNSAETGGGLYCFYASPNLSNNTICENHVDETGGGIYCHHTSSPEIVNSILWANGTGSEDDEIYLEDDCSISISFSDIQGGWDGEGNIDIDPLFRDPENGDFHLMAIECDDPHDSPCIDMGTPGIIDSLLDCDWGLGTQRSDMGAYGGGQGQVVIDEPENELPKQISLFQNCPNPFNASTTIKYELPRQSRVTIEIYDILGRKISTLINAELPAGYHQAIWHADNFASGMYFYKLQAGNYSETKKMLLLK